MSSKSTPSAAPKSTGGRKRPAATNGRSNGNGNGHGPARAMGGGSKRKAQRGGGEHAEVLDGQPRIEALLGLARDGTGRELDKKTLLSALIAFRKGDFSARLPIDLGGMDGKIADTFNDVIELNERMSEELERLSRVVGKEGKITQRASVGEVTGSWQHSVDSVNALISDLVHPTSETARVIGAVAKGDLSQTMATEIEGRPLAGEFLRTARTVNTMVEQLGSFASEVTRVAREVGTEGKLGGQAKVKGVAGTWKDLTDSVNLMAGNLTGQVRNIAAVTTAVANGDLSKKITVDVKGEILELKNTINTMVDQLRSFASEVTRVAREVGTEGKLGGQADVKGVAGTWKDLTDSVNSMAGNLTSQVRNIAAVTTAVANGDLSKKITVDVKGEILELKNTINTMVDQLNSFASEVTRVAREVGTEGKLGGQAEVKGVAGTWKDLTDSVNSMAGNLTGQVRNIAAVTTAVARGDLTKKITVDVKGEIAELKNTINVMVDQLSSFAAEVTRVAREVGTEGKLGGQADVRGVAGTWKDLTDNVNLMAGNLTSQVRNIADVTKAVAAGDLSKKITVDVKGEILELKSTVNIMVDQLSSFAAEVTRVAREVGTEGRLGGQADVRGVAGVWKDLTDNVNLMASNLTVQLRDMSKVATAIANGDLTQKIAVDARGEILQIKNVINTMVDQLSSFASEVTRVAREVGTEGELGGQADVKGVAGTWKDLTDSVNSMAANLTSQVRNIANVTTAVANGDLSKKITVPVKGEILELKNTINTMVDQLNSFASEVTRVAREVGTEGKLGGQAEVKGIGGTWKDLTDNVNSMASNLTGQVRNIAAVTTAVANGDLSKKITVETKGEILELKNTINTMVDQLSSFAAEVTRVAREVGTEGKLGGQAEVRGVAGTWKDLTDSVNSMAGNLTSQVRNIADVTKAVANGDLSKKITVDVKGEILELKNTVNTMVDQLRAFASEVTRVAREVGTEGKLGGQANVPGVTGAWKDLTDNVNFMASNLTGQVRNIAQVTTAVANGDLSKKITVDVKGEILELKLTINTMVEQLNNFASEVTRVAREVGTEGKLGGQAEVKGVAGTWKDLTDNVNFMADRLTNQVRGIAKVVTAVANGDLKRKLTVDAKGEIAELADTINSMIDTLATFADQVTTVAREVGVEGKLGGQASVPGAAGTWKDLTDNVNQLAANLTTQVRAIAEVATAVTKGDLTRSIAVQAEGEVAALKDNINEMIRNLKDTTLKNAEQDWLKTNLAKFSRMLQGQKDLLTVGRLILSELAPVVSAQHGVFYIMDSTTKPEEPALKLLASYAYKERKNIDNRFKLGEGLVGQCALEKEKILLTNVPTDYIQITSGLGEAKPLNIIVMPVVFEGQVKAVLELASFDRFNPTHETFLDQLTESIGIVLNTIEANMRTEDLLKQSQSLARELQSQQEELQQTNAELEEKAKLLADQNVEVERKNKEVEQARQELENKAKQLALTSKYKSEFLANMSHELRTPLNSLLILSDQLSKNAEGNLSGRQVEFARTIHASGNDLLTLINDILDLSKIESGTVIVDAGEVPFRDLQDYVDRTFRHVAESKRVAFDVEVAPNVSRSIHTDAKRLQQILKNLLSNAFKFTEKGRVAMDVRVVTDGWSPDNESLNKARTVIAMSVSDTGIGIPPEKQQIIFEAFQQADGSTSRKYGGTGLGLAISREIAAMLGGEIKLTSTPGEGSTFTLLLPQTYVARAGKRSQGGGGNGGGGAGSASADGAQALTYAPEPAARGNGSSSTAMAVRPSAAAADGAGVGTSVGFDDDANDIRPGDPVLLIVENDLNFARYLMEVARDHGFKAIVAPRGAAALKAAREFQPSAVTLDINLPDIDGWRVLDRLKDDVDTRHIPVHLVTTEEDRERGLRMGAMGVLTKPVRTRDALDETFARLKRFIEPREQHVLLVDGSDEQRARLAELLAAERLTVTPAGTAADALAVVRAAAAEGRAYDVVITGLELPDRKGFDLIDDLADEPSLNDVPVMVYSPGELTKKEETHLKRLGQSMVLKDVRSPERLADEVALFLHRRLSDLPEARRQMLRQLHDTGTMLAGKKVLIVDDDIRNIFAMTSLLEPHRMNVMAAETGRGAIEILQANGDIDVVLMDIMMPDMDGYDTMRAIRKLAKFRSLPIIAVTAKAMKGDRERCIDAGASDYISKPVDAEQLLALLRVWLYR
jgi:HAMP domain-containing protein/signal transduction histidine kinase/CheY-like chemotaxis protein